MCDGPSRPHVLADICSPLCTKEIPPEYHAMDPATQPTMTTLHSIASGMLLLLSVLLLVAVLNAVMPLAYWQWCLRRIPGPVPVPILGNLADIVASGDFVQWRKKMANKYGAVFKVWVGSKPLVIVTNTTAVRTMFMHEVDRPNMEDHVATVGDLYDLNERSMIWLPGHTKKFRTFRRMFDQTLLSPSSLASHGGMLAEVASRLARHVTSFASSGETFDASSMCADMAMEAIGFAAMGLDLNCLGEAASGVSLAVAAGSPAAGGARAECAGSLGSLGAEQANHEISPARCTACSDGASLVGLDPAQATAHQDWMRCPPGSHAFSVGLVDTCRTFLMQTDVTSVSRWTQLNLLLPALKRPLSHLAQLMPDARLKANVKVRNDMMGVVAVLINDWRQHKQAGDASSAMAMSERGFLSQLLAGLDAGRDDVQYLDIISQCILMLLAGYETTASSLSVALHLLSRNPAAQLRAQQEVDTVLQGKEFGPADLERLPYIKAVFDETLRLYPPAEMVMVRRLASAHKVPSGSKVFKLPAGVEVMANACSFQRNPAYWPRPEEFLPERHIQPGNEAVGAIVSSAYAPFGYGARMCPGFKFAQMEARLALAKLMQNYTFKPAPGCAPPRFKSGVVYIPDHVWLVAERRK